MRSQHITAYAATLLLSLLVVLTPVNAAQTAPAIPILGRNSNLTIRIYIPANPKWAHDLVLNATITWNQAQLWDQQHSNPTVYTFVESDSRSASAKVSFSMPKAYASFAVGWTDYKFAQGSRTVIVSTQTYLDPTVFNQPQVNQTARMYAFRLALHEMGRILGLGSILDGRDLMDPRGTIQRASQPPNISTLDLYAIHVLATGTAPSFVTLPQGVPDKLTAADFFLRQSYASK
jgi:hypothetical protein